MSISIDFSSERLSVLQRWHQEDLQLVQTRLDQVTQERDALRRENDVFNGENRLLKAELSAMKSARDLLVQENTVSSCNALKCSSSRLSENLAGDLGRYTGTLEPRPQEIIGQRQLEKRTARIVPAQVKEEVLEAPVSSPSSEGLHTIPIPSSSVVIAKEEDDNEDLFDHPPENGKSYLTELPPQRLEELKDFPDFVPPRDERPVFTRYFLSQQLGGGSQPLIVGIGKQKPLSKSCGIKKFLVPNLKMNPWCPRAPGCHGFMFVGLGAESGTFEEPELLELFLSVPPRSKGQLEVSYLGSYLVVRVNPLTSAEWRTLSPTVQKEYVDCTANRTKARNPDIQRNYDLGKQLVPCVRLTCVGFNEALFGWIRKRGSDADEEDFMDIGM
ncbi:hypothetical protein C8F01DRAFT_1108299 [Mycena amicta]|nr:hypothetical protein C8F01DRAFT_1108299 [Mycena amicta]